MVWVRVSEMAIGASSVAVRKPVAPPKSASKKLTVTLRMPRMATMHRGQISCRSRPAAHRRLALLVFITMAVVTAMPAMAETRWRQSLKTCVMSERRHRSFARAMNVTRLRALGGLSSENWYAWFVSVHVYLSGRTSAVLEREPSRERKGVIREVGVAGAGESYQGSMTASMSGNLANDELRCSKDSSPITPSRRLMIV